MTATHDLTEVPQDVRDALTAFLRATADAGYTGAHLTATTSATYVSASLTVGLPPAAIPVTISLADTARRARYETTRRTTSTHTGHPDTTIPPWDLLTPTEQHDTDLVSAATVHRDTKIAPCARYDYQTGRADFVHTHGPCTLPPTNVPGYLDALAHEPRPHA